jgi:hypothetical protein
MGIAVPGKSWLAFVLLQDFYEGGSSGKGLIGRMKRIGPPGLDHTTNFPLEFLDKELNQTDLVEPRE